MSVYTYDRNAVEKWKWLLLIILVLVALLVAIPKFRREIRKLQKQLKEIDAWR